MILGFGLIAATAFFLTCLHRAESNQLYLQPEKSEYGYFTNQSFVITCLTTDDSSSRLSWVGTDETPITATEGRIHIQQNNGQQKGLGLVIQAVQKDDAGQYVCSDDRDSITFELLVYKAISFGDTPKVQHAVEGGDASITCHAKADSELPARLNFNGSTIAKSNRMKVNDNGVMIFNVSRSDAGIYTCTALLTTSSNAQVKEMNISFHVWYMPEFAENMPSMVYASMGGLANLSCIVSADPAPMFQWMQDGSTIHNSSDHMIFNNETVSILQLTVNDMTQFGDYLCRASNEQGTEERIVKLEEGDTPIAPQLKVVSEGKGTLTLSLQPMHEDEEEDGLSVNGFKVQYVLASGTWDQANSQEFKKGDQYILNNVSYNTEYLLRATARNAAGFGDYSYVVVHKTQALQVSPVVSDKATVVTTSLMLMIVGSCILWVFN